MYSVRYNLRHRTMCLQLCCQQGSHVTHMNSILQVSVEDLNISKTKESTNKNRTYPYRWLRDFPFSHEACFFFPPGPEEILLQ